MEITEVKVFPVDEEKLKAYAMIIFDHCFVVRDLKIISGTSGLFVAMPSKKRKDGSFKDVAHPLNRETRQMIEQVVIDEYHREVEEQEAPMDEAADIPYGHLRESSPVMDPHHDQMPAMSKPAGGMNDDPSGSEDEGMKF